MRIFNIITGCCSIAGLIFSVLFLLFKNETCAWITVGALCLFLIFLLFAIVRSFVLAKKKAYPDGYVMDFIVISYDVISDQIHQHDLYKIIQSKRPFLYSINHGFSWSGTNPPIITSRLQEIGRLKKANDPNEFDEQELILKRPLLYNQTTTAHFHAELDDSDGKAQPYLAFTVKVPMSLIFFKVILRNKPEGYSKNAIVERIPTKEGPLRKSERIGEASFDATTKSYTYVVPYPEAGYRYKISWDK